LNVPAWIRDFLLVEFTFRTFCKTVPRKIVALAKSLLRKSVGESTGHAVEGFIDLSRCTPDHASFMKTLFESQFSYVPKKYLGRVIVCVAKTQPLTHFNQVEAPWRKIAPWAEIVKFRGTHTSLIRTPNGLAVAKYLKGAIANDPSPAGSSSRRINCL